MSTERTDANPAPAAPSPPPRGWVTALLLATGAVWCWLLLSRFTGTAWNDIRLVPAFMLAEGEAIYPAPGTGIITTWMYGPLPLVLLWPATQMPTIGSALIAAGLLNILLAVATIALVAQAWPSGAARPGRWLAGACTLLLWPESSLRYLQADNAAVLFGAGSLLLLARHPAGRAPGWAAWGSAAAAVAAMASKQIAVGAALAGLAWIALAAGSAAALRQLVRLAAVGAAAAVAALILADPAGLWLALVAIPQGLPWVGDPVQRLRELAPGLAVSAGLPLLLLLADRRRWFARGTPHQLAAFTWIACLPLGLLAAFKTGGSINSFHGYPLLLPVLLLDLAARARFRLLLPAGCLAVFAFLAWPARHGPWQPSLEPVREAVALARRDPGRIWFPWHPLVSWYAERRFHHAEDGMYARFVAQQPLAYPHVRRGLPENFGGLAMPVGFSDWGIATSLVAPGTAPAREGSWQVWRWEAAPGAKTP